MLKFDEINQLRSEKNITDIETYFDTMDLSDEEKEERKQFSREMQDVLLFIFALYLTMKQYNRINTEYIQQQLQKKYSETVLKYIDIDDYLEEMIADSSQNIVDTTMKHDGEEYYTSEERAALIACNSANDTLNYRQYSEAIKEGKTKKQWITEKDERVRKTHRALDDVIIPIKDTFLVGDTLMRFPHDTMYGIDYEQLSNCRCTIKYF